MCCLWCHPAHAPHASPLQHSVCARHAHACGVARGPRRLGVRTAGGACGHRAHLWPPGSPVATGRSAGLWCSRVPGSGTSTGKQGSRENHRRSALATAGGVSGAPHRPMHSRHKANAQLYFCNMKPSWNLRQLSRMAGMSSSRGRMVVRRWNVPGAWPKPVPGTVEIPVASRSFRQ